MMTNFKNAFVYPKDYSLINQRILPDYLYDRFNKKILFRIKVSPNNPFRIMPPNGLLVYGPPGNGKSILVKQFAQMTGYPYIVVRKHDVMESEGLHANCRFKELMMFAKTLAPCVIIMENVETMIPDRRRIAGSGYVDVMSNLSLLKNCGRKGIFVFATTSKPKDIDAQLGMSGYLNELFYTPFPDEEQRMNMITLLMEGMPCKGVINYDEIVRESADFTIGDIVELVGEIALDAAIAGDVINNDTVRQVLETFRHPLTSFAKKEYDEIHAFLEAKNRCHQKQIIGFRLQ